MNQIMKNLKKRCLDVVIYVFVRHVVLKYLTGLDAHVKMKFALNVEKTWSEKEHLKLKVFN